MKSVDADNDEYIEGVTNLLTDFDQNNPSEAIPEIDIDSLRLASIIQTRKKISDSLTLDKNLIQILQALDDSHTILNLVSERLCTWYAHTKGESRMVIDEIIIKKSLSPSMINLKNIYISIQELIEELSNQIDKEAPKIFPNMVKILDSQLTVRLVSCAGSLAKIARLPSSTIQLLGAEKALFRHVNEGTLPPKYGILYQHPSIKGALKNNKGKMARSLASKVAIASKIDYYRVEEAK